MRALFFGISGLLLIAAAGGCATFEYDVVEPAEVARHVGRKSEEQFRLEPLDYGMISYENRLIVRVGNPTEESVQLVGAQSVVVDPRGESHPLRSQTIAPHTFIR